MASRVAKLPVVLPTGVSAAVNAGVLTVKGSKGELKLTISPIVAVACESNQVSVAPANDERKSNAMAGTTRALVNNMVIGVSEGFTKKLTLIGVGYRAQAQGNVLNLTLGFSHPVNYNVPAGVTIETPSQTEILVKGADKQIVGQVAAEIRAYRSPEPYKGKGVRYADEVIVLKETKKK